VDVIIASLNTVNRTLALGRLTVLGSARADRCRIRVERRHATTIVGRVRWRHPVHAVRRRTHAIG